MPATIRRFAPPVNQAPKKLSHFHTPAEAEAAAPEIETSSYQAGPLKSRNLSRDNILNLQRTIGNQAVMRMLQQRQATPPARPAASPKPTTTSPGITATGAIQRKLGWDINALAQYQSKTARFNNVTKRAASKVKRKSDKPTDSTLTQILDSYRSYLKDEDKHDLWHMVKINGLLNQWFGSGSRSGQKYEMIFKFREDIKKELVRLVQPFLDRTGLTMSFINELVINGKNPDKNALLHMVEAESYLKDGKVGLADAALQKLKGVLEGPYNVIKGQLVRAHIGEINPEMAELVENEKFEQDEYSLTSQKGTLAFDSKVHGKYYDDYKQSLQTDDKRNDNEMNEKERKAKEKKEKEKGMVDFDKIDNHLTSREKDSIYQYADANYTDINNSLRNMKLGGTEATVKEQFAGSQDYDQKNEFSLGNEGKFNEFKLGFTQNAVSGLNKLDAYVGEVYRHDKSFGGFTEVYREGAMISDMAFTSSTYNAESLMSLSSEVDILTIMKSKTGRFIKPLSPSQHEDEVLFKPGTRFLVRKVIKAQDAADLNGKWPNLPPKIQKVLLADRCKDTIKYIVLRDEV